MTLIGHSAAISLKELFSLFQANEQRGVLEVRGGSDQSLTVYFQEGRLFLPDAPRKRISDRLRGIVARVRETGKWRLDPKQRNGSQRPDGTRRIEEFLLRDDLSFEFQPGDLPERVRAEIAAGNGRVIEPTALLIDAARHADERSRIRRFVPSRQVLLRETDGARPRVEKALAAAGAKYRTLPITPSAPLDTHMRSWGGAPHDVLATVALLVERGDLEALPVKEAKGRLRSFLDAGDLPRAAEILSHLTDRDGVSSKPFKLELERALLQSRTFLEGGEVACALRMRGARVFSLVQELIGSGAPVTLVLRQGSQVKRFASLPGVMALDTQGGSVDGIEVYLARQGGLSADELRALIEKKGTLRGAVPLQQLEDAVAAKISDEIAEVVFWEAVDVELRNRGTAMKETKTALILRSTERNRSFVLRALEGWRSVFDDAPSEFAVFVGGERAKGQDDGARFFSRFSLYKNVGELRRSSKAGQLPFAKLVAQGVRNKYLSRPDSVSLSRWVERAHAEDNPILAYRLTRAGIAFGYGTPFSEQLERFGPEALLPGDAAAFEGDLAGVGLPALLQILNENNRTGTLVITGDGSERASFYCFRGELYVLPPAEDEGADPVRLREACMDVVFWEGARFSFFANDLPTAFFSSEAKRVALRAQDFLLKAVKALSQRDVDGGRR